jgi:hypothetical protein
MVEAGSSQNPYDAATAKVRTVDGNRENKDKGKRP